MLSVWILRKCLNCVLDCKFLIFLCVNFMEPIWYRRCPWWLVVPPWLTSLRLYLYSGYNRKCKQMILSGEFLSIYLPNFVWICQWYFPGWFVVSPCKDIKTTLKLKLKKMPSGVRNIQAETFDPLHKFVIWLLFIHKVTITH